MSPESRIARARAEQAEAAKHWAAGDHSRGVRQWMEDWIREELDALGELENEQLHVVSTMRGSAD